MRVRRMVTRKQLVRITEKAIEELIEAFKATPYFFYTENDLHCYLYHRIYSKLPPEDWQCETEDEKSSILLHKEYPTKQRYRAKDLKEVISGGRRGHFDLSIWNPEETEGKLFRVRRSTDFKREQQTFIAIEFDLIEGNDSLHQAVHHFKWDLLKLRGAGNEIEHGYALVFVRDWIHRDEFLEEIEDEVAEDQQIVVLYVESSRDQRLIKTLSQKSFLNYERIL